MQSKRRDFLKKSLKVGAVGAVGMAASVASANGDKETPQPNTVRGKSPKKEVLYFESEAWQKYYKVAY